MMHGQTHITNTHQVYKVQILCYNSGECKDYIFCNMTSCSLVTNLKWLQRWSQHILLKCWYPRAQLHSVIFQKTMSIRR